MDSELERALQHELVQFDARDIDAYRSDDTVKKYMNMIKWSLVQIVRRTKELQNEELDAFSKQLARECLENSDGADGYVTNIEQANPTQQTKKRKRVHP